jgi:UDP-N-acetylmuramoylalanine-D-glutamate ligase
VLNVTDNHLDRYDGIDDYAAAKARIFAGNGAQILNRDDPRTRGMRVAGRYVETFGGGVPQSESEWGLVARGNGAASVAGTWRRAAPSRCGSCARRAAQRIERAGGAGDDIDRRKISGRY